MIYFKFFDKENKSYSRILDRVSLFSFADSFHLKKPTMLESYCLQLSHKETQQILPNNPEDVPETVSCFSRLTSQHLQYTNLFVNQVLNCCKCSGLRRERGSHISLPLKKETGKK